MALILSLFGNAFGQTEKPVKGGIINGRATYLPIPEYPQEAKDFCAGGIVEVEVLVSENGNVIEAKAISGDELLRDSAVKAVKKAKFRRTEGNLPVKIQGVVVYNFDSLSKCVIAGIANKAARSLPKPQVGNIVHPRHLKLKETQIIGVVIIVDENGNITNAKAISGHPMLRSFCVTAARYAKFAPSFINSGPIRIKALLIYKIKPDGTVDTDIEKNDKDSVGTAINLVQPPPPFCNCRFGGDSSIIVETKTDERGNVIEAIAINGHPILKKISEKAALESKFLPTNIKAKITIIYNFEAIGEDAREVRIKNVEVKEVKF